jgi:5-methyltetrahydropteroyltriglutamate--homocysteine methyltransferase
MNRAAMLAPFALETLRVDFVGSFLRPPELKDALARHRSGALDDDGFHSAQDAVIRKLVATQEAHGLPIVNDGEFRRFNFNESFAQVAGMEPWDQRLAASHRVVEEGV